MDPELSILMPKHRFIDTPLGVCLDGAGPQKLAALLAELDELLATMGVNLDTVLQPGISAGEVRDTLATVDLIPPDELLVWYGWHNGLRVDANNKYLGLSPFVAQADLDWSIGRYQYDVADMIPLGLWMPKWLCIESDRGMAIHCSGNPTDLPLIRRPDAEIYDFLEESSEHQIVSLSTMVAMWIQALEEGIVWPVYSDGFLEWGFDGERLVEMDGGRCILT
jgi:hypothetical protein